MQFLSGTMVLRSTFAIMYIRLLFWFIILYFLLRFIIRVLIPVVTATRNVRSKMNDINENMEGFNATHSSTANKQPSKNNADTSSAKGDYIDFEEIK